MEHQKIAQTGSALARNGCCRGAMRSSLVSRYSTVAQAEAEVQAALSSERSEQ